MGRNQVLQLLLICIIFYRNTDNVSRSLERTQVSAARAVEYRLHSPQTRPGRTGHSSDSNPPPPPLPHRFSRSRSQSPDRGSQRPPAGPPASYVCLALFLRTVKDVLPRGLCTAHSLCLRCCQGLPSSSPSSLHAPPPPQKLTPAPLPASFSS